MTASRPVRVALFLFGILATMALLHSLRILGGLAHAATAEAPITPATPVPGIDWNTILLGAIALFSATRTLLAFIAPRTQTTLDDRALARIEQLLEVLQPPRVPVPLPVRAQDPQSGRVRIAVMAAIAIGAIAIGCATVRERGSVGAQTFMDCQADNVRALMPELQPLAESAIMRWISGDGRTVDTEGLRSAARALVSDASRCAWEAAIAVIASPVTPKLADSPAAAPMVVDGSALRARWSVLRAELGWPAVGAQ